MADDPFSIWGEPSSAPVTSTIPTTSNSKTSLDFLESIGSPSLNLSSQEGQTSNSNRLFADDSIPTWDQPSSPATQPEKTQDQDPIPQLDQMGLEHKEEESQVAQLQEQTSPSDDETQLEGETIGPEEKEVEPTPVEKEEGEEIKEEESLGKDIRDEESDLPTTSPTIQPPISTESQNQTQEEDSFEDFDTPAPSPKPEEAVEEPPAASTSIITEPPTITPPAPQDDFDDFDEFGETNGNDGGEADDDFGDFGDFDDGSLEPEMQEKVVQPTQAQGVQQTTNSANWPCLQVDLNSTSELVSAQIRELLSPPLVSGSRSYPYNDGSGDLLGTERLRQVEGSSQVLVSEKSRQAFSQLSKLPSLQPISWTRSLTRRSSLISLGIPINLDEVSVSSSGMGGRSTLPPLALTLDSAIPRTPGPSSAPGSDARGPPKKTQSGLVPGTGASTSSTPRTGSPGLNSGTNGERMAERRREELGLGPAPELDWKRAEELVALTEDQLTLQSLPALRSLSRELHSLTTSSSSLLTHHLTLRESHSADAEMYDSMIRDLVMGASNRLSAGADKSASSKGDRRATTIGLGASASAKGRAASGVISGRNSPRPASPAINSPRR